MAYTKGPWFIETNELQDTWWIYARPTNRHRRRRIAVTQYDRNVESAEDNARLMQLAPDLLGVCKIARDTTNNQWLYKLLDEIIVKAE